MDDSEVGFAAGPKGFTTRSGCARHNYYYDTWLLRGRWLVAACMSDWEGKDRYERENILVDAEARGLTASSALCALGLSSLTAWLVLCVWLVSWVLQDSSQVLKGASEEVHCAP